MMSDWSEGYVIDTGYTHGYYGELNPVHARLAFLNAGLAPVEVRTACELGFGQGVSINIHAAASDVEWHGTDFNPEQVGFARDLAAAAGADVTLRDDSFAEFARRDDLPEFDFIGLHGVWSWISDENRAAIVEFVRRKLAVRGILYVSYNTLPGWSAVVPLRHLMTLYAEMAGTEEQGIAGRIDGALDFADRMMAAQPSYARDYPSALPHLIRMKGESRDYLAHEFFNRDWQPMHFATMARWLGPTKATFACSAHYLDHCDAINLSAGQQAFLQSMAQGPLRQSARDFMVNQHLRRDYWVKGARRLTLLERIEALRRERVMLTVARPDVSLKVTGALGEAALQPAVYEPVLEALVQHRVRTLGDIEEAVRPRGLPLEQIVEAVMLLAGAGQLASAPPEAVAEHARQRVGKLNSYIVDRARHGGDVAFLASPLISAGVPVGRVDQLFLRALATGGKLPDELASFAWQLLAAQSQHIFKDGKSLETPEENLAELAAQATAFMERRLPVLRALQVVA